MLTVHVHMWRRSSVTSFKAVPEVEIADGKKGESGRKKKNIFDLLLGCREQSCGGAPASLLPLQKSSRS